MESELAESASWINLSNDCHIRSRSHLSKDLYKKSTSPQFFRSFLAFIFLSTLFSPWETRPRIYYADWIIQYRYIIIIVLYTYNGVLTDVLFIKCIYIIFFFFCPNDVGGAHSRGLCEKTELCQLFALPMTMTTVPHSL